ncbi:hypothetical protein FIBSPDRAFT_814660 [Athelia psychrophila]|uniref:Uncharacterized protein n=1 Tax=Athelia psychrophila TaxID=1759441 RepID=A0A166TQ06_9AGAM|nr:hypothetical protein FIBSPDRAFT_814660 [Fibularhizoctonia sp. CBS 109695]
MPSIPNLDDLTESVAYIPYQPDDDEPNSSLPEYNPFKERDLPGGCELRLEAYRAAWGKCLQQIQTIIKEIHGPIVEAVVQHAQIAYSDVLPGLPYHEMPVITVTGGAALLHDIAAILEPPEDSASVSDAALSTPETFVTHLYPGEKPNIGTCMKSLIAGFVDRPPDESTVQPKRKPSTSLAVYDIELLEAWYDAARKAYGDPPQLVVLLHDFEQFEPAVIQDVFYICSLHVPRLPLVFVLSLSPPPPASQSYIHLTYPRSTLALLRVQNVTVPSGMVVLEEILQRTFFDFSFDPDIVLGPVALDFLVEFFGRHAPSLDVLITILQLAHLKHFEDPLTALVQSSLTQISPAKISSLDSEPFFSHLLARVQAPPSSPNALPSPSHVTDWRNATPASLLTSVDEARDQFRKGTMRRKVALGLFKAVRRSLMAQGIKSAGGETRRREGERAASEDSLDIMCRLLRGRLGKDARWMVSLVKKLHLEQLRPVLDQIRAFFHELPSRIRMDEEDARTRIVKWTSALPASDSDADQEAGRKLSEAVGEWLAVYFQDNLAILEEERLWDIWYTGSTPFPSEMINPSVRASIISGLLHPFDYIIDPSSGQTAARKEQAELWELPDTSILFMRYLDSGKMINVYDWYESFGQVVDSQRMQMRKPKEKTPKKRQATASPRKKGKQRQLEKLDEEDGEEVEEDEEAEEKWKLEVQARFMRALHELDYLGFIKHTGRKADHVLRTVFDIVD